MMMIMMLDGTTKLYEQEKSREEKSRYMENWENFHWAVSRFLFGSLLIVMFYLAITAKLETAKEIIFFLLKKNLRNLNAHAYRPCLIFINKTVIFNGD